MKKYFEYFGLITLICFSFFITEQTVSVVKEVDDIMVQIKNNYLSYTKIGMDAIIFDGGIIPGLNTKKVNIEKSYQKMKEKGVYDSNFYIYDSIPPNISIVNNFDKKIVSGNKSKKLVSFIFFVDDSSIGELEKLVQIEIPINIIVEPYNIDKLVKFLGNNSQINILANADNDEEYALIDTKLKSLNLKLNYCYSNLSNWCIKNKISTIKEKEIIESQPLLSAKKTLPNDNILLFKLNNNVLKELPNIVQYVKTRGYRISLLDEHLSENW